MKIGFDAKRAFKNNTGLGNYSRMIICALADSRIDDELFLFTPGTKGRYTSFFDGLRNVQVVTPAGLWRLFPNMWRTFGIAAEIRRRRLDIYHGLSHELPFGRVGETRLVVSMHDLIVWRFPKLFPLVDRMIYKVKQRYACRRADIVVAISKQTERDLVELMGVDREKIHVVYQSCDAVFRVPVTAEQRVAVRKRYSLPERYLICVGTIEQRKNQKAVVEAMAAVPDDVHLVVVGRKTAYYDVVANAVRGHTMGARIHFLERVDFGDFPALYSEAVASVYMSLFEGFGIPVLESLACGTPVVASCRSSIPEVGGDAVLYADPDKPQEIAERINSLLSDADLYAELRSRSFVQAGRFEPKKIASDLLRLYSLVTSEK